MLFDEHERGPSDDLRLQSEVMFQFRKEERKIVKALLDGTIVKFQTKQLAERVPPLDVHSQATKAEAVSSCQT